MQRNPMCEDNTFKDLPNVTKTNVATGATYFGENIFTVPSTAKKVLVGAAATGNVGGYFEIFPSSPTLTFDLGIIIAARLVWNGNNIRLDYLSNSSGYARNVDLYAKYTE